MVNKSQPKVPPCLEESSASSCANALERHVSYLYVVARLYRTATPNP